MFGRKKWVADRFCAGYVRRHTVTKTTVKSKGRTRTVRGRRARR
jgi:hypothetical protein